MTRRKKTPKTDPAKAVAYLRVSTEDQHLGPEAQEHAIREWASRQGITLVAIHTDTATPSLCYRLASKPTSAVPIAR